MKLDRVSQLLNQGLADLRDARRHPHRIRDTVRVTS